MWRHKLRYYLLQYTYCPISQERHQSIKFDQSITWEMLLLKYHTQYVWRNSSQILLYKVKIKHIFGSTVWILIQFLFNLCSSWGYLWKYPSQCTQRRYQSFLYWSFLMLYSVCSWCFTRFYSVPKMLIVDIRRISLYILIWIKKTRGTSLYILK